MSSRPNNPRATIKPAKNVTGAAVSAPASVTFQGGNKVIAYSIPVSTDTNINSYIIRMEHETDTTDMREFSIRKLTTVASGNLPAKVNNANYKMSVKTIGFSGFESAFSTPVIVKNTLYPPAN